MKNNICKNLFSAPVFKELLTVLGGFTLVSCGIHGYTETDGIYYDPNTDKIEQRIAWQDPKQENEDYDYEGSIISHAQKNQKQQNERYNSKNWGNDLKINTTSDWGTYTGTQNNYYHDSCMAWGNPYNFYFPYHFGYYNSYFGHYYSNWNMGLSWGSPWGYASYDPYYWGYNPYWGHQRLYGYHFWYYDPFYSPFYGGYYGNYYGYPSYYNGGYYSIKNYKRSNPDIVYRGHSNTNRNTSSSLENNNSNRGSTGRQSNNWGSNYSNDTERRYPSQNQNYWGNSRLEPSNGGFRSYNGGGTGGFGRTGNNGTINANGSGGFRR